MSVIDEVLAARTDANVVCDPTNFQYALLLEFPDGSFELEDVCACKHS